MKPEAPAQLEHRLSLAAIRTIITLPRSSVTLGNPYVVFFQPTQRDLPLNGPITSLIAAAAARDPPNAWQTNGSRIQPWCGNVLVAKYADVPFGEMIPCGMNDLPIISRYLQCHEPSGNELDVSKLDWLGWYSDSIISDIWLLSDLIGQPPKTPVGGEHLR